MPVQAIEEAFRLNGPRQLTPIENQRLEQIRFKAAELATLFYPTDNREKELAMMKLEEAVMWGTKGITGVK
jgi:hypothetical protein